MTVPLAIVSACVTAFAALQMMPALLSSGALPIVLVVMWRGRKRRETPTIM